MKKKVDCCRKKSIENEKLKNLKVFLDAISEENRLRIVCILGHGERCVCDIYKHLELPQNLTSYHLNILEMSKIISSEKRGLKVFYKINNKELKKYLKFLNKLLKI